MSSRLGYLLAASQIASFGFIASTGSALDGLPPRGDIITTSTTSAQNKGPVSAVHPSSEGRVKCRLSVLLTSSSSLYPNPLSSLVVSQPLDAVCNAAAALLIVPSVVAIGGASQAVLLYALSGTLSSFAYLFSVQCKPKSHRLDTEQSCTSNGALCGLASYYLVASFTASSTSSFSSLQWLTRAASVAYIAQCVYEEHVLYPARTKMNHNNNNNNSDTKSSRFFESIRNAGCVGGIFYGLIHQTLFSRTRMDWQLQKKFYSNLVQK